MIVQVGYHSNHPNARETSVFSDISVGLKEFLDFVQSELLRVSRWWQLFHFHPENSGNDPI